MVQAGIILTETGKTFGTCPLCDLHGPLIKQHVRPVPELKGYRIMICRSCHDIVSQYEDEVQKVRQYVAGSR